MQNLKIQINLWYKLWHFSLGIKEFIKLLKAILLKINLIYKTWIINKKSEDIEVVLIMCSIYLRVIYLLSVDLKK